MESPLYAGIERKVSLINKQSPGNVSSDKMNTSLNSTLEDITPSDSGVQMMDSESSELMVDSITSQSCGFEYEEVPKHVHKENTLIDSNSNLTNVEVVSNLVTEPTNNDLMETSISSTFDTTENIVYRRRARKSGGVPKAPKKRVSFHEDILKNTRTDNIHIEHGFITYKNGRKINTNINVSGGRYSWCPEGDAKNNEPPSELYYPHEEEGFSKDAGNSGPCGVGGNGVRRCVVYRNACSDVLDYGNSDIYDTNESTGLKYDNSGIFEYMPNEAKAMGVKKQHQIKPTVDALEGEHDMLRCSCSSSSSNSSLDSDETDKNSNRSQYGQAKSSSCDCIGMSNGNNNNNNNNNCNKNNMIGESCYFSEPNIENMHKKSVWNKEKKPKSSCLKKTKRHTDIIQEHDLTTRMKKFNVHDMNQLFDNSSKMIIGSLKSIFTMPLTERGLPEGSEDVQSVIECIPEQTPEHKPTIVSAISTSRSESPPLKAKPFLSKSLDGSRQQQAVKKFVHNVDEQLRRKNEETIYAPTRENSAENKTTENECEMKNANVNVNKNINENESNSKTLIRQNEIDGDIMGAEVGVDNGERHKQNAFVDIVNRNESLPQSTCSEDTKVFRNKFIINCESTVFEHTGVSYTYEASEPFKDMWNEREARGSIASLIEQDTPIAQPANTQLSSSFISAPIAKTFSNFFRSFKESNSTSATNTQNMSSLSTRKTDVIKSPQSAENPLQVGKSKLPKTSSNSSGISDLTSSTHSSMTSKENAKHQQMHQLETKTAPSVTSSGYTSSNSQDTRYNSDIKQSRHLPSPLRKRPMQQPQRYGVNTTNDYNSLLSPDLFNGIYAGPTATSRAGCSGRDSKSTLFSEEFDDILTITTDTDKNESDIVIVDYPEVNDRQTINDYAHLLKPPQAPAAKTSLINRFLRNVTQKKMIESSMRKNNFFNGKLRNEQKLFTENLYVKGVKRPKNYDLIDDLNAEIAMEIEMSANSPRRELVNISDSEMSGDISRFELGIGEISTDIFNGIELQFLRDPSEHLMKVFKLYTGYSSDGHMTPVLVFLTDKTLYVIDLVRNCLCSKFVLPYTDLDVILMGPYGNTVLLSNSERDMQQVLLAGGPYPADGLVANLELCARRSGASLPAVGQLTLEHLAPLQTFVRANSSVNKDDTWMYYAVVNVPAGSLNSDQEPLGPHVKGFLMHRRIQDQNGGRNYFNSKQPWNPGYFLLKAGVLYMFSDSNQKLPSWAMALAECQGARRALKSGRPHCFEIILRGEFLQLAAPDEYVASEWLQALLQSASGLFEMQEKHKTLGCSLIITENHLITLREDFSSPLRQVNRKVDKKITQILSENGGLTNDNNMGQTDTNSLLSSARSTPTRGTQRSCSSMNSTPTKLSQLSRSSLTGNTTITSSTSNCNYANKLIPQEVIKESYSNMSSVYGKNSGLEILTSADIKDMISIKIPSHNDTWWCILEFSCQEVRESSDDLVIFFASRSEMQRFLRLLEQLWQAKNNDLFPITVLDEDDLIAEQCSLLYMDINRSWEPLLSAALGYPL